MLACLILGSVGFIFADLQLSGRLRLTLDLGFQWRALRDIANAPLWRIAAEVVYDLVLIYLAVGRLHDISRSGWWLAALAALPFAGLAIGLPEIGAVTIIGWLALVFWPGTIGPNAYGGDPRGWKSREQYEAQKAALERPSGPRP